jgi:hypothetical protein
MMRSLALKINARLSFNKQTSSTPQPRITSKKKKKNRSKSEDGSSALCLALLNQTNSHEQHSRHHKKRKRSTYEENYSAALALPCSSEDLENMKEKPEALITYSESHIKEHAARRVDLFFYTMIAYYNTQLYPIQGHTDLQHGRGRNTSDETNMTQACHSSLIPSLIDDSFSEITNHESILSETHFLDNLNATVELPIIVNEFDGELENTYGCRQQSIYILQRVSAGEINPIQGLNQFIQMLEKTLKLIEMKIKNTGTMFSKIHPAENELFSLVKKGTLAQIYSGETQAATNEYIESLLRLKPEEIAICKSSDKKRKDLYQKKIAGLQAEIINTEREQTPSPKPTNRHVYF